MISGAIRPYQLGSGDRPGGQLGYPPGGQPKPIDIQRIYPRDNLV